MDSHKLWIGGKWVETQSGKTFATFNPATGEEIAQVPLAGRGEIDEAVAAARQLIRPGRKKPRMSDPR